MLRALLAEFIGTFFFISVILIVTWKYPGNILVPFVVGLALALGIYFAISASLGSLNPAVTLALYSRGDLSGNMAILYMIAEFFGAMLAFVCWSYMFKQSCTNSVK